jgi:hypothetical protein
MTSDIFTPPVPFSALDEVQRMLASVKRQWRIEV